MKMPILFSKLSEGLGTALTGKYQHNPYTRSTVNIVLLQVLLTFATVLAFAYALNYHQQSVISALEKSFEMTPRSGAVTELSSETTLAQARDVTLQYTLLGLVLLTVFFGYMMARFALKPVRDSLSFQKRFIGNMAHEIRTPLAVIKTNSEVTLLDPNLDPQIRDTLTITIEELDRISETINNLLSFDKLIRPSAIAFAKIDLSKIAETVVERHRALAASRGIDLALETGGEHIIIGNATGIEQVLTNLVKNALNYTPRHQDGSVLVSLRGDDREATVTVTDTGIGIAKRDLYYIFQPFYRADTSRVRGVGGGSSGLGLAIVNEIVKAHHGKIFVRSELNRGTTIEVTFPTAQELDPSFGEEDGEGAYEVTVNP